MGWKGFKDFVTGKNAVAFGKKSSRTASIIASTGGGGVVWTPRGYENFSRETYLKNVTAFRCIDEIATSVASVKWKHFKRVEDKREAISDSNIANVLKRPSPRESFEFVMRAATSYLVMSGNCFFERVGPETGPNVKNILEMYSLRPDRFKIDVNQATGNLKSYIYTVNNKSVRFDVDESNLQCNILHLKTFHPLDDWWGAAPTEAAAMEIDTSNASTTWNMSLLQNQGRPGMIFSITGELSEAEFDRMERYLRDNKAGPENVGENLLISGGKGTKVTPYGWSPTDMDFSEGDLRLMRKICMAYRVPPMLLGIPGEATFANFKEARLAFWESTVFWYLNYFRGEFNNWLFEKDSEEFVDYTLDDVPALSVKRDALWERAQTSDFMTLAEKREMVGLPEYQPSEDPMNQIFIEASKVPIGTSVPSDGGGDEVVKSLQKQGYTKEEIDAMTGGDYS